MVQAFRGPQSAARPRGGEPPRDLPCGTLESASRRGCQVCRSDGGFIASRRFSRRQVHLAPAGIRGGGARTHAAVAQVPATLLEAPVVTSPGPTVMPSQSPLYAGRVGPRGNAVASDLAKRADVILALSTRLGFNTTFYATDNLSRDAASSGRVGAYGDRPVLPGGSWRGSGRRTMSHETWSRHSAAMSLRRK